MTKTSLQCKICSVQCNLTIETQDENILITGNNCGRGLDYAKSQISKDKTILKGRCILLKGSMGRLPVISSEPISRDLLDSALELISNTKVLAPVKKDQVIISNILNTSVDIISQRRVK